MLLVLVNLDFEVLGLVFWGASLGVVFIFLSTDLAAAMFDLVYWPKLLRDDCNVVLLFDDMIFTDEVKSFLWPVVYTGVLDLFSEIFNKELLSCLFPR